MNQRDYDGWVYWKKDDKNGAASLGGGKWEANGYDKGRHAEVQRAGRNRQKNLEMELLIL